MNNKKLDRKTLMEMLYQTDLIDQELKKDETNLYDTYKEIMKKLNEIDNIISNNLYNYTLNRLAFIDRAIIRLAVFELKYSDLDASIIINQAIFLTKKYSDLDDEKQHKFTNKLLDNINKSIRG